MRHMDQLITFHLWSKLCASRNRMDSMYFLGALLTVAPYFVSATFQALVEKGPLVVPVGEDAILPCWLSRIDQLKEVRWFRIRSQDVALINLFRDGKDRQTCHIPRYVGRTELITTDINSGKVALKIRNVSVADEGAYRCFLETLYYFDHAPDFELKVTALGSHPRIDLEEFQGGRIKAVCRSEGWYPEPMLLTKDTDGKMVELESSNKIQNKDGLYYIEYSRLIAEKSSRSFSCILRTAFPNQERESSLYVADAVFRKLDSLAHWWTVGIPITLSIIGILVAALVFSWFWFWCSKRRRDDVNEQSQEDLDLLIKDKAVLKIENGWMIMKYEALQRELDLLIKDKGASSGANTENCHLNVPPEEVSRDSAPAGSEDPSL